jgi:hypothetical protein
LAPTNPAVISTKTEEELTTELNKRGTVKKVWGGILGSIGLASLISGISQL